MGARGRLRSRVRWHWLAMAWLLLASALVSVPAAIDEAGPSAREAWVIELTGAIGPAGAAYVEDSIAAAQRDGAELLILRMDTPGGLDTAMRAIIQSITAGTIPVVGYVAPTGARAASAGTYILYACPVAAMAPGTNLGAATPVQIGGVPTSDPDPEPPKATAPESNGETAPPAGGDAAKRKVVNDAAAYLRALAALHGRNADWAERAVREGASLSAEEALEMGVIDLIAPNLERLLEAIDGRRVRVQHGERRLDTQGLTLVEHPPNWSTRLLAIISDPSLAYILLLVGIYGLIYEFANPGAVLPGTVGAVSLLLALYAFQLLPVNYAGLALIGLGLLLMIAEVLSPSFGGLGLGGIAAFVIGSLILIDTEAPGFGISLPLILSFALASALVLFLIVGLALKARRHPVVSGREELVGALGEAVAGFPGDGSVHLFGEVWSARSEGPIPAGTRIRVKARDGLTLLVEPAEKV
jgi:membrane-bound serine protease (ClpP class)